MCIEAGTLGRGITGGIASKARMIKPTIERVLYTQDCMRSKFGASKKRFFRFSV